MGGWTVLYYILKYPPTASTITIASEGPQTDAKPPHHGQGYLDRERSREDEKDRVQIAGAFVMCPMVEGESYTKYNTHDSLKAVSAVHRDRVYWTRDQVLCWQSTICQGGPRKRVGRSTSGRGLLC
jgi:hypothetical protein